jgi:hypothetical protein
MLFLDVDALKEGSGMPLSEEYGENLSLSLSLSLSLPSLMTRWFTCLGLYLRQHGKMKSLRKNNKKKKNSDV